MDKIYGGDQETISVRLARSFLIEICLSETEDVWRIREEAKNFLGDRIKEELAKGNESGTVTGTG